MDSKNGDKIITCFYRVSPIPRKMDHKRSSKKVSLLDQYESESETCSVVSNSLLPHGLYSPCNSPGQNTGVGSCSLLQGIFPTQGSNPGLPTLQADSLPAEPQGKPKNTGVGSLSFSSGSSQPRNQTRVSCTSGRFFTN